MADRSGASGLSAVARGARHPASLVIAAATVAAGLLVAPWLAAAGVVLWLAVSYALGRRPTAAPPTIDTGGLPPSIQRDLAGVQEAVERLRESIDSLQPGQRELFAGLEEEAEELREAAARLALAAGALHARLARQRPEELQSEIDGLRERLEVTGEEEAARRRLQQSIEALQRRLARRSELMERLERYRSTLGGMQTEIEDLADRAGGLARGEEWAADEAVEEPRRRMDSLKASVAAAEEVMGRDVETA
ncbi:MAG: hypothetical protein U9R79_00240 [Armatimonadota bacterium]|nr:hypothetical protein [Armatimonadota bacterium]